VLTHCGKYQGAYELSASVNGKPSWTSQSTAIWYIQDGNTWEIGNLNDIGKPMGAIYTTGILLGANENAKWNYSNGKIWKELATYDFSIECIARKGINPQYLVLLSD
jgi:hypothetical protein